ncbi:MAG: hypothetical protein M3M94_05945 [Actinomycetota bacterium]|nr:hypothetical protein [Actinomycetota bacterium]
MRLYPDLPSRRASALGRDGLVLVLLLVFAWIGLEVHDAVDRLAVLGEGLRRAGESVPLVGDPVEDLGRSGEERVHRLANLLGFLTFALPAAVLLAVALPRRLAEIRRLRAAERVVAGADARLVAMRAAFSLPYGALLAHTDDPLGDLEQERYDRLVAAALEYEGLRPRR